MEAITSSNPSPFLALPIELRLKIYRLSLIHPALDHEDAETYAKDALWLRQNLKTNNWPPPSLCATNRQIRAESLALFYSENHFHFFWIPSDPLGLTRMERGVALLAEERRGLRMGHLVLWFRRDGVLWYDAKRERSFNPVFNTMEQVARLFRFLCVYAGKDVEGGDGSLVREIVAVRPPCWLYPQLLEWAKLYHAHEVPNDRVAAKFLRALIKANKATCPARLVMVAQSRLAQLKRRQTLLSEGEQSRWNGVLRSRKR